MKKNIESKDISVIVRGLVVGQEEDEPQRQYTRRALESVRRYLPDAQLILSSWKGSNINGLDYDELVLSDEPERIEMSFGDNQKKLIAANHQIVSARNGLTKANRRYTISMRSDIILTHTGFISYFLKYNQFPPTDILSKRILTLPTYNPKRVEPFLFDVCDWFYFGVKQDIEKIFSIPLMQEGGLRGEKINGFHQIKENLESEQYIWTTFLRRNGYPANITKLNEVSPELIKLSEQSYARYTIMVSASKAGIICLKMPHAGYGAKPWLSQGLYTMSEYNSMYNKYNKDTIYYIPNILESIMYPLALFIRKKIAQKAPAFYKIFVNMLRRTYGSHNTLK